MCEKFGFGWRFRLVRVRACTVFAVPWSIKRRLPYPLSSNCSLIALSLHGIPNSCRDKHKSTCVLSTVLRERENRCLLLKSTSHSSAQQSFRPWRDSVPDQCLVQLQRSAAPSRRHCRLRGALGGTCRTTCLRYQANTGAQATAGGPSSQFEAVICTRDNAKPRCAMPVNPCAIKMRT